MPPPPGHVHRARCAIRYEFEAAERRLEAQRSVSADRSERAIEAATAIESSKKLGRHRWVVGRTHSWFNCFRRLPFRYEQRADIYEAFTSLAASLITLNQIKRFC